jgi:phosphoglucosamine mutase
LAGLFGTDGVRGVANRELTPELAYRLGRAAAAVLLRPEEDTRPRVLIGRDTRASGPMLEAAMVAGFTSAGVDVFTAGIIPTPGVAFLTKKLAMDAGVVISASHNPVEDNGIKFFSGEGFKLSTLLEEEIEGLMEGPDDLPRPTGGGVGRLYQVPNPVELYVDFLAATIPGDLTGLKIVVDCGHGAAYQVVPQVMAKLGAQLILLNGEPNGVNINVECGSTHPHVIQRALREEGAHLGLSHDGDADRLIAVDEQGAIVDGDGILAICGLHLLQEGRLPARGIAATVYSNLALTDLFQRHGGRVVITPAGDRHVLEGMQEHGFILGGEQSGHIIFLEHNTTGDGVLTGLQLASLMKERGLPLSQLAQIYRPYPQVLVNVRVRDKGRLEDDEGIKEKIREAEARLQPGRIFVRASGTEPVVRVMGEGADEELVRDVVEGLAAYIGQRL